MKRSVKIGENSPNPLYMPKDLVEDGFTGETYLLANFDTATIVRPGAKLEDVKRSLELILQDVTRRIEEEKNQEKESDESEEETQEIHVEETQE